jgi:hypothetical protein
LTNCWRDAPLDLGGDVAEQRVIFEEMMAAIPLPADVTTSSGSLGGIPVVNVEAAGADHARVIFYVHGGRTRSGWPPRPSVSRRPSRVAPERGSASTMPSKAITPGFVVALLRLGGSNSAALRPRTIALRRATAELCFGQHCCSASGSDGPTRRRQMRRPPNPHYSRIAGGMQRSGGNGENAGSRPTQEPARRRRALPHRLSG